MIDKTTLRYTDGNVQVIFDTLALRDPNHESILVGGAAITLHLANYGLATTAVHDVDVIASEAFCRKLYEQAFNLPECYKFQIRHPKQEMRDMGSAYVSIDIIPTAHAARRGIVPFSAHKEFDTQYSISYDEAVDLSEQIAGIRVLKLHIILEWISIVGRDKDLRTIESVFKLIRGKDIITPTQQINIEREYYNSLRQKQPGSYYARIPGQRSGFEH
ncbi:MAG: hypothetical protein WAW62_03445 [Candidatus Saccharimonas aalborgensis]|jgi:hypothetical protein